MPSKIRLQIVFGILGILWIATGLRSQTTPVVAVRAGRLFDSNSGQEPTRQVVLVQGDRIIEVGSEDQVKIPQGAQVIDLGQATILPGLIDGHSHIFDSLSNGQRVTTTNEAWTLLALKEAQTDLRSGFTTMRDCGTHGEGYGDVDVRDAINRGLFDGPRLQVSTRGDRRGGIELHRCAGSKSDGGERWNSWRRGRAQGRARTDSLRRRLDQGFSCGGIFIQSQWRNIFRSDFYAR